MNLRPGFMARATFQRIALRTEQSGLIEVLLRRDE